MNKEWAEVRSWLEVLLEKENKPLSIALIKKAILKVTPLAEEKIEEKTEEKDVYVQKNEDNAYIGFATMTKFKLDYSIDTFFIVEEERGKGYGSLLMEAILNEYDRKELFIQSMSFPMDSILLKNGFFEMEESAEELWVRMPKK